MSAAARAAKGFQFTPQKLLAPLDRRDFCQTSSRMACLLKPTTTCGFLHAPKERAMDLKDPSLDVGSHVHESQKLSRECVRSTSRCTQMVANEAVPYPVPIQILLPPQDVGPKSLPARYRSLGTYWYYTQLLKRIWRPNKAAAAVRLPWHLLLDLLAAKSRHLSPSPLPTGLISSTPWMPVHRALLPLEAAHGQRQNMGCFPGSAHKTVRARP